MKTRSSRQRDGYSSTEGRRQLSNALNEVVATQASPHTVWDFLLRVRLLPVGLRGLEAIVLQSAWVCEDEWLQLETKGGPRIVWNPFRGFDGPPNLKTILTEGKISDLLVQASHYKFGFKVDPIQALGKLLEADTAEHFSSVTIGYVNGTLTCANPVSLDLDMMKGVISKESRSRLRIADEFPVFFQTKKSINECLKDEKLRENIGEILDEAESRATLGKDREATHWLVQICRKRITRQNLRANGAVAGLSLLRTLASLPRLVLRLSEESKSQGRFAFTSHDSSAAKLLYRVCPREMVDRLKAHFDEGYRRQSSLKVYLVGLDAFRNHFGLDSPYPSLDQTECCARRVILLITSCGRRLSCLFGVTPEGFFEDVFPLLCLGRTKVAKCAYFRLPLGHLLPETDVEFIQQWITSLSTSDRYRTFLDLAGIDRTLLSEVIDHAEIHNAYADLLRKDFHWSKRPRLHDLRRMGITWLSVRLALAHDPCLSALPFVEKHLSNFIFRGKALNSFAEHTRAEDPVDFMAKIAGHASRVTTRKTYNFAQPIHTLLQAKLRWDRMRDSLSNPSMRASIDGLFS